MIINKQNYENITESIWKINKERSKNEIFIERNNDNMSLNVWAWMNNSTIRSICDITRNRGEKQ